ncbi:MAG: elongation factor G [Proteobacteria bacterium]|nr:elongation factor G [Pseudomonadota bacterium]
MDLKTIYNIAIVGRDTVGKSKVIKQLLSLQSSKDEQIVESPEEEQRGYTIYNRFYRSETDTTRINYIDTPGNTNFLPKVKTALNIANSALFIVSGTGISDTSLRIWESIIFQEVPRAIFINMLDLPEANFDNTLHDIELKFSIKPLVLYMPYFDDGKLVGIIDVLEDKLLLGTGKNIKSTKIPSGSEEEILHYRDLAVEQLSELDEELMELYIEGEEITKELLAKALVECVQARKVTVVMGGCAKSVIGFAQLKDFIETNFASFTQSPIWVGTKSKEATDEILERGPEADGPFSAFSFKILHDRYAGKLSYLLVISGTLKKGFKVLDVNTQEKTVVSRLNLIHGEKLTEVDQAGPGDIVVLEKQENIDINHTLCDPDHPVYFEPLKQSVPRCTHKLVIPHNVKEERVLMALHRSVAEDPSLRLHKNEETGEFLLSGMGVMHLQVLQEHLQNVYEVEIELELPNIAYHETIAQAVKAEGKHKKQTGGHGQFGVVRINMEPLPRGGGFEFVNKIVGGVIPRQYISSVEKGVVEALQKGTMGGFPVVDVRVTLYDGQFHNVDSSDYAFQAAGILAIRNAQTEAKNILLEPIMEVEIDVPEHDMGKISKDIASRRGRIQGFENREFTNIVKAEIPLSELQNYTPLLREMTQGLGMYTMQLNHYEVLSSHLAAKVIKEKNQNSS